MTEIVDFVHGHMFCGIAGGAKGFNKGEARLGCRQVRFRCAGGMDVDAGAIKAFTEATGVQGTVIDLFTREQYASFHGRQPAQGWREATPVDVLRAMHYESLDCLFLSAPCKGFSGLLSQALSESGKYQALNQLALRGLVLALEAYKDRPIKFVLFENVPRIQSRGRWLLDQIIQILHAYGYAAIETTHDCGELAGLHQSRNRFLLVARHMAQVPAFLYEPQKRPLRPVGQLLERFAMPGDPIAGPMHRLPALQWKTWVRLAFVEAGSDWRSLQKLRVEDGHLTDYGLLPDAPYRNDAFGVTAWEEQSGTVTGDARPSKGAFSVADPRIDGHEKSVQMGVRPWNQPGPTVTAGMHPGQGPFSVADPRLGEGPNGPHFNNCYRVVRWADSSPTVTAGSGPSAGGMAIADPRTGYGPNSHRNKLRMADWNDRAPTVTCATQVQGGALSIADPRPGWDRRGNNLVVEAWDEPSRTVIAGGKGVQGGWLSVADPRLLMEREVGDHYRTCGHYGVVPWTAVPGAVTARLKHDNGPGNIADPRVPGHGLVSDDGKPGCNLVLPAPKDRLSCVIRAIDGTWHRPFTTLELAALQGLVDPDEHFVLPGVSDSQYREWIGNAVPPPTAAAIASEMGRALLLSLSGETFVLSATPIWVRPIAVALAVDQRLPA